MEIWVDSINIENIKKLQAKGIIIYGITTNPSTLAQSEINPDEKIKQLLQLDVTRVAIQILTSGNLRSMLEEALKLAKLSKKIIVKIPINSIGLQAISLLKNEGLHVIASSIFDPIQVFYAAQAGADYIAPALGRMEKYGKDYAKNIMQMQNIIQHTNPESKLMGAAINSIDMMSLCAELALPSISVREEMLFESLNPTYVNETLEQFSQDWKNGPHTSSSTIFIHPNNS